MCLKRTGRIHFFWVYPPRARGGYTQKKRIRFDTKNGYLHPQNGMGGYTFVGCIRPALGADTPKKSVSVPLSGWVLRCLRYAPDSGSE